MEVYEDDGYGYASTKKPQFLDDEYVDRADVASTHSAQNIHSTQNIQHIQNIEELVTTFKFEGGEFRTHRPSPRSQVRRAGSQITMNLEELLADM
jgi:hypothetical protein